VSKLITRGDGKPTLAPASDPRPAIGGLENDFEVLSDD
jgi:hypothetical protein